MSVTVQIGEGLGAAAVAFQDVPCLGPVRIVLLPIGGQTSQNWANKIYTDLAAELARIGTPIGPTPATTVSPATDRGQYLTVVALIADSEGWNRGVATTQSILTELRDNESPTYVLLPVLREGDSIADAFPANEVSVTHINFEQWKLDPSEIVASIMASGAIAPHDFRVFVSYRRKDTQKLAEQLFLELVKQGFDVFLDRYAIPPGVDFQSYLIEQLDGMSTVLFLESPSFESMWTKREAAFAARRHMGLMSVTIPGGQQIASVQDDNRIKLDENDLERSTEFGGVWLKPQILNDVVQRIKREHNLAFLRRRRYLQNSVEHALREAGIGFDSTGAVIQSDGTGTPFKVWVNPRVPSLPDYHFTFGSAPTGALAAIVAPHMSMAKLKREQLLWIGKYCGIDLFDPEKVRRVAKLIKGKQP